MSTFYAPSIIFGTKNAEAKKADKTTHIIIIIITIAIIIIIPIITAGNTYIAVYMTPF